VGRLTAFVGLAASVLFALFATGYFIQLAKEKPVVVELVSPKVAEVAYSVDALWGGAELPDENGWLPAGFVQLKRGQAEIRFSSGAVAALKAPAEFKAVSSEEAVLKSGALTARVDGTKTKFRVHTPTAEVIDLGTEFGLSVADSGETDVAVFDGLVDICSDPKPLPQPTANVAGAESASTPRRLSAGEALRVDWQGKFRRITTVTDKSFPPLSRPDSPQPEAMPPLISAVSDTLRDSDQNPMFYRIVSGGFRDDCLAYVDRSYEWNGLDAGGLPEFLLGADYVMPFNADKAKNLEITLTIDRPCTIYVLFDDRGQTPQWLKTSFVDTGFDVGIDEGPFTGKLHFEVGKGAGVSVDYVFSAWRHDVAEPGKLVLGPRGGMSWGRAMYGIVAVPLAR
jgi:hypothetical protein